MKMPFSLLFQLFFFCIFILFSILKKNCKLFLLLLRCELIKLELLQNEKFCACSTFESHSLSTSKKRIKKRRRRKKNRNISYLFSTLHKMQNEKWKGKTLFFVVIFFDSDFFQILEWDSRREMCMKKH